MRIAVIGSGYVGLVAAACFAELGHDVTCVDKDEYKIEALRRGSVPIHEKFLPELITRHSGQRLTFTTSTADAVRKNDLIFIAVGTPPANDGAADLSYVESVAREVAQAIDGGFKLVVEKSTVPVYTNEWVRRTMLANGAPEGRFEIVSNPEFLREGTAVTDFLYPDRIVIGCNSERAAAMMRSIYQPLLSGSYAQKPAIPRPAGAPERPELIETSAQSAELIKHACNAFLAMKISFINAIATLCEHVGADIDEVCRGIGSDPRIGSMFLRAGLGYGGSCFPKDISAFRTVARECGYELRLLEEVVRINHEQRQRFVYKVRGAVGTLKGKRLGVLGLAFKGGTDDIRESPAVAVIEALRSEGCRIVAFDPAAIERAKTELNWKDVSFAATAYDAAARADALLILTDWDEFAELDLKRVKALMRTPVVVDGRNLFSPQQMATLGFDYYSVGRRMRTVERFVSVRKAARGLLPVSPP
jgi:UDPglucose 6-dehydrogenase